MQGLGLALAARRWAEGRELTPQARRELLLRHLGHFNTQAHMGGFVIGMVCRLEAEGRGSDPKAVRLKDAVSRSLAAVGDALFWGTLRPGAAALGALVGLVLERAGLSPGAAWTAAAAAALVAFNAPALWARWAGLGIGYRGGESLALDLARIPWQGWIVKARRAGFVLAMGCALIMLFYPVENRRLGGVLTAAVAAAFFAGKAKGFPAWALYGATVLGAAAAAQVGWIG